MPTPTLTAKTSNPKESATTATLSSAAAVTIREPPGGYCVGPGLDFESVNGDADVTRMMELGAASTCGGGSAVFTGGDFAAIAASSAAESGRYFDASAVTVERNCERVNGLLRK
jgi:hypothetical protein